MMVDVFDLVIFGGGGDLSRRKLLPALYAGFVAGRVAPESRIYLTSRSAQAGSMYDWLKELFTESQPACPVEEAQLESFAAMVSMVELRVRRRGPPACAFPCDSAGAFHQHLRPSWPV